MLDNPKNTMFETLDETDKYVFGRDGSSYNDKAFTDFYFDLVMKRFYGVFEENDKIELHQIQFDECLMRTVPGRLIIKTKATE